MEKKIKMGRTERKSPKKYYIHRILNWWTIEGVGQNGYAPHNATEHHPPGGESKIATQNAHSPHNATEHPLLVGRLNE